MCFHIYFLLNIVMWQINIEPSCITDRKKYLYMKVIRAKSAGFCWGVERAIKVAREESDSGSKTVFTDGPLIHNRQMMDALSQEDIREVGDYQSSRELNVREE